MLRISIALAVLLAASAARAQVGGTTQSGTATQAGAGGQGSQQGAQPGQAGSQQGGASQQVVVNPPNPNPPPPQSPPAAPPASTTVVNPPPPPSSAYGETVVVDREPAKPPMATIATGAAWGGLAGLLVGTGISLIDQWNHWQRDMMIGTGVGVLVGAAVGGVQAYSDQQRERRARVAFDGMGSTARDPVARGAPVVLGYAGRF